MEALCQAILGDETLLRPPPGALSQRICQAALFVDLLSEGQGRVGGEGGNVGYGGGGPFGVPPRRNSGAPGGAGDAGGRQTLHGAVP